jgi:hypothetical protein
VPSVPLHRARLAPRGGLATGVEWVVYALYLALTRPHLTPSVNVGQHRCQYKSSSASCFPARFRNSAISLPVKDMDALASHLHAENEPSHQAEGRAAMASTEREGEPPADLVRGRQDD